MALRNVGTLPQHYKARPRLETSPPPENLKSSSSHLFIREVRNKLRVEEVSGMLKKYSLTADNGCFFSFWV